MKEMHRSFVSLLTLASLLAACNSGPAGQGSATRAQAPGSSAPSSRAGGAVASAGTPCDRQLITAADLAGILNSPITGSKNIAGDPQSCSFTTSSFPAVEVSLRPTNGRITVETWSSGKMPLAATPLAGVGDHAAWVPSLNEVDAEKDDVLCVIGAPAPSDHYRGAQAELEQRLGALCNKIFAANAR
jgi:hypothetical protein